MSSPITHCMQIKNLSTDRSCTEQLIQRFFQLFFIKHLLALGPQTLMPGPSASPIRWQPPLHSVSPNPCASLASESENRMRSTVRGVDFKRSGSVALRIPTLPFHISKGALPSPGRGNERLLLGQQGCISSSLIPLTHV